MKFALAFTAVVAATTPSTALVKDMLEHGHAPGVVFVPTEKRGAPATMEQPKRQATAPKADPIHVEQMINFHDQPVNEEENGFMVIG